MLSFIRQHFTRLKKAKLSLGQLGEMRNIATIPGIIALIYLYEYYKRDMKPIGPEEKIPVQSWDKYVKEFTTKGKEI